MQFSFGRDKACGRHVLLVSGAGCVGRLLTAPFSTFLAAMRNWMRKCPVPRAALIRDALPGDRHF
jgi:hypothetical protein